MEKRFLNLQLTKITPDPPGSNYCIACGPAMTGPTQSSRQNVGIMKTSQMVPESVLSVTAAQ